MHRRLPTLLTVTLLAASLPYPAPAQQSAATQNRPAGLDPAAIRRDAARLADIRALLADPDPNIRLMTMREVIRTGDPAQRSLAVDVGLSSADASMVELALRSVVGNVKQIVITLTDLEGKPVTKSNYNESSVVLTINTFDQETGQFTGINGTNGNTMSGQLQGSVLSFVYSPGSGILTWDAEAAEFRGRINLYQSRPEADRKGNWRPR